MTELVCGAQCALNYSSPGERVGSKDSEPCPSSVATDYTPAPPPESFLPTPTPSQRLVSTPIKEPSLLDNENVSYGKFNKSG